MFLLNDMEGQIYTQNKSAVIEWAHVSNFNGSSREPNFVSGSAFFWVGTASGVWIEQSSMAGWALPCWLLWPQYWIYRSVTLSWCSLKYWTYHIFHCVSQHWLWNFLPDCRTLCGHMWLWHGHRRIWDSRPRKCQVICGPWGLWLLGMKISLSDWWISFRRELYCSSWPECMRIWHEILIC
jgi:hypothetical protein